MQRVATPLLVSLRSGSSPQRLERKDLLRPNGYDEHWVQTLIHEHPTVLPVDTIEPAFWPLSPVCMELPLRSGYLDNLFITPAGDIIAVECKLWRNMQARREVIAQLFDYAKDLQAHDYTELETAVRKSRKEPSRSLWTSDR